MGKFGLCIAERYYILGKYRIEHFDTLAQLENRRKDLDKGVTTWIEGEPMPKRRETVGV